MRYVSQGDDVTVTENEIYHWDGETPAHAVNALFVGGIPETPERPDHIPHFTTDTGSQYASIDDNTKKKNKHKNRPMLKPFASRKRSDAETLVKSPIDDTPTANVNVWQPSDTLKPGTSELDGAFDNPGYTSGAPGLDDGKGTIRSSAYDYIDHDKLKRDDEAFEESMDDYMTDVPSGSTSIQNDDDHYKRFIRNDSVTENPNDGYLTSPTRNKTFDFPT